MSTETSTTTTNVADPAAAHAPRKSFKGGRATWCPGCGDYGVLASLDKALVAFGRPEHDVAVISGIGCSSRFPYFMNTYGFHTAHGRALPVATGLKLARPDLTVIATGGDGDALAIGGNHFFHTMRRNPDITYILMDNQIYGMTKGQAAPTSKIGMHTKSSPFGTFEQPVDPIWAALTMGATYVAQVTSADPGLMTDIMLEGLRHPGMAFINCLSPCVTFNAPMDKNYFKELSDPLPEGYDPSDYAQALTLMQNSHDRFPIGLIYTTRRPTLEERAEAIGAAMKPGTAPSADVNSIMAEFM